MPKKDKHYRTAFHGSLQNTTHMDVGSAENAGAIFSPYFLYMPYVELHISNDWSSAHRHECDNQILMLILQDQLDNAGSLLRHRSTVHDYYRAG